MNSANDDMLFSISSLVANQIFTVDSKVSTFSIFQKKNESFAAHHWSFSSESSLRSAIFQLSRIILDIKWEWEQCHCKVGKTDS
jgi:hypothetical protein